MSSTTAPETELRSMDRRSQDREARRVILSSYLGSTIEYYDLSKELQDEIINRTEQSFDDYSDAGSEYPKNGCGC